MGQLQLRVHVEVNFAKSAFDAIRKLQNLGSNAAIYMILKLSKFKCSTIGIFATPNPIFYVNIGIQSLWHRNGEASTQVG